MKKINLALFALFFWSSLSFANFNFLLYNHIGYKLVLGQSENNSGGLYLPNSLAAQSSDIQGHSTSTNDYSIGSFTYAVDRDNYCAIAYTQKPKFPYGTSYSVKVAAQKGKLNCTVNQNSDHPSIVEVHYKVG